MKHILYFEIIDKGIQIGMETSKLCNEMLSDLFNGCVIGIGTDAESALDDMLHNMQKKGYDVTELESQIKEEWEPSSKEGNGYSLYYHFGIVFKYTVSKGSVEGK